jgi:hypothetical protein
MMNIIRWPCLQQLTPATFPYLLMETLTQVPVNIIWGFYVTINVVIMWFGALPAAGKPHQLPLAAQEADHPQSALQVVISFSIIIF